MSLLSRRGFLIGLASALVIVTLLEQSIKVVAFVPSPSKNQRQRHHFTSLSVYRSTASSSSRSNRNNEKSKRQERVGHLVRNELSTILHRGTIKGDVDGYLNTELRQRISIVNVDLSPDLKQARVSVSIRAGTTTTSKSTTTTVMDNNNDDYDDNDDDDEDPTLYGSSAAVDKRRAYSWLVRNQKPLRHTLAQRMSHMKACPDLTFVQVDVAAAVDVMYLIDKVSKGYKRDVATEQYLGADWDDDKYEVDDDDFSLEDVDDEDDDDDDDDDDWEEEDDGFFKP